MDTAPHRVTDYPQQHANVIAGRPAHDMNDRLVTLRAGARAESMFRGGAAVLGGRGLKGYVWAVTDGEAVVDFGTTSSGHPLRVIAAIADLAIVAS